MYANILTFPNPTPVLAFDTGCGVLYVFSDIWSTVFDALIFDPVPVAGYKRWSLHWSDRIFFPWKKESFPEKDSCIGCTWHRIPGAAQVSAVPLKVNESSCFPPSTPLSLSLTAKLTACRRSSCLFSWGFVHPSCSLQYYRVKHWTVSRWSPCTRHQCFLVAKKWQAYSSASCHCCLTGYFSFFFF